MEADRDFVLIAITPPDPVADEALGIAALLDAGWWRVHLRHPGADAATVEEIINAIPPRLRDRVSLHDHFGVAGTTGIGGLHLNRRSPSPPCGWKEVVSRSCHSVDEVRDCDGMDYVTLSPVFDSISKPGYRGIAFGSLPAGIRVMALGGVTPDRLPELRSSGFAGAAMLGAVPWHATVDEIKRFATKTLEIC